MFVKIKEKKQKPKVTVGCIIIGTTSKIPYLITIGAEGKYAAINLLGSRVLYFYDSLDSLLGTISYSDYYLPDEIKLVLGKDE